MVVLDQPPGATMSEADLLLRKIVEHADLVGCDSSGRPMIQLAIDAGIFDRLTAFGTGAASEGRGDEELSAVPAGSRAGKRCFY